MRPYAAIGCSVQVRRRLLLAYIASRGKDHERGCPHLFGFMSLTRPRPFE